MTTVLSVSDLHRTVVNALKVTTDSQKKIEKTVRRSFPKEFEAAFEVCGGAFAPQNLPSSSSSDDEASCTSESATDAANGSAGTAPGGAKVVTLRSAYLSLMVLQLSIAEQLVDLGLRVRHLAKLVMVVDVAVKSCEPLPDALKDCFAFLKDSGSDRLAAAAGSEILGYAKHTSEVARRTRALLFWAKLSRMGDEVVAAASPPPPPPPAPAPLAAPQIASQPAASALSLAVSAEEFKVPAQQQQQQQQERAPSMPATVLSPTGGRAEPQANNNADNDDDYSDCNSSVDAMDATDLLNDVADQLTFKVPTAASAKPFTPVAVAENPLFNPKTEKGRRNLRGKKLLEESLQQTDEPMSQERRKLVSQCPTLRDMMSAFGKTDYNIISFIVRSTSQQIGESGPVLWTASLDVCVSTDFDDEENRRKKWADERTATEPLEPSEREKYRWVELVRSEPCTRGSHAKLHIVSKGAQMLFPQEFEVYCSLKRDDVVIPPASTMDDRNGAGRVAGQDAAFGRMVTFSVDRTSSFLTQAIQLVEKLRPELGTLTVDIAEERGKQPWFDGQSRLEAYTVNIYRGDGTLLLSQSSNNYSPEREVAQGYVSADALAADTVVPGVALVPTLFDALHILAQKVDVLGKYQLLKKSFDRLCLPVANEPREYVLNYMSLVFGMCPLAAGVLKDAVEMIEHPLGGGWTTAVRVGYPRTPANRTCEFKFVQVESRHMNTKKAARNEALMYAGKTNFTAEMLHMLDYGPMAQKGHAETILTTNVSGVIPAYHDLQAKLTILENSRVVGAASTTQVGTQPANRSSASRLCHRLIVTAIERNLPEAVREAKASLSSVQGESPYELHLDMDALSTFFDKFPAGKLTFGAYTPLPQFAEDDGSSSSGDAAKEDGGVFEIIGQSPIAALNAATRLLRDKLEKAPENVRTVVKELRQNPDASSKLPSPPSLRGKPAPAVEESQERAGFGGAMTAW